MEEVVIIINDSKLISAVVPRCRICHEEEFESSTTLEAPCSCSGTVKFAHRDCIQRWCNEKGNTICELCLQQYQPGYTAKPKKSHINDEAMSTRMEEEESNGRIEIMDEVEEQPECNAATQRSASCCRTIALAFTFVLLVRHIFAVLSSGTEDYPFTLVTVIILKASGIILPMYIIIRTIGAIHNSVQRHYGDYEYAISLSDTSDESESRRLHAYATSI
ncbi:hypothetical protein HN51_014900 [Arachis hypogaea]|uniref:RING-CH-type domain-containing protein n=1 Tax=Arachis hypogaea TaxID=3818 RepID=A0A445CMP8_ARAHY|nr:E3 ubiquitin-protein ligase MARCH8 [Arachis hypogaea]RYR52189.1 hypothetical protein Ahy_A06g027109 [Arachis hypogaea]